MGDEQHLKQKLFILKNNANSLSAAQNFLRNRNWFIKTAIELKEALAQVIETKPSFILIPLDYNSKKTKLLPKLFSTAHPAHIILYIETMSSTTSSLLREMNSDYVVYPPISGPAVERMILKILRDNEEIKEKTIRRERLSGEWPAGGSDRVSIAGAKDQNDNSYILQKGGVAHDANSMNLLQQMLSSEFGVHLDIDAPGTGLLDSSEGSGERPNKFETLDSVPRTHLNSVPSKNISPLKSASASASASANGESAMISTAADYALDSVAKSESKGGIPLSEMWAERVGCLEVKWAKTTGFLIVALGSGLEIDESLNELIKERFVEYLDEQGDSLSRVSLMNLVLKTTEFDSWSRAQAEFLKRTIHKDDDIAVAFFPGAVKDLVLEYADDKEMVRIELSDIEEGAPLEFNLYLHMPFNKRYLLYTPKDMKLYQEQIERLRRFNVTTLAVPAEQSVDVRRFHVQKFLNGKIDEYHKDIMENQKKKRPKKTT